MFEMQVPSWLNTVFHVLVTKYIQIYTYITFTDSIGNIEELSTITCKFVGDYIAVTVYRQNIVFAGK